MGYVGAMVAFCGGYSKKERKRATTGFPPGAVISQLLRWGAVVRARARGSTSSEGCLCVDMVGRGRAVVVR